MSILHSCTYKKNRDVKISLVFLDKFHGNTSIQVTTTTCMFCHHCYPTIQCIYVHSMNQPPRKYKMEFWRQGHEKVSQLHTTYLRHGFFDHKRSHKPIKGRSHFVQFLFAWFCFNMLKIYTTFWMYAIIFALMWFGIHHNFQFQVIWLTWSMVALFLCHRLAESEVTVMPSVTCIDWLHWSYNHAADVVLPSTALAFVTKMSKKCKSILYSVIQVKNWRKTVSTKEKLDIISQLEKGTRIADIHLNVRFAHTNILTIRDNADRITESAKSDTEVFV